MHAPTYSPNRERGTTLLIALVFLVILTLFAVSGMKRASSTFAARTTRR